MACVITESDCCGNGCANCILDSAPLSTKNTKADLSNKINVLHNYCKHKLIERQQILPHILQLKFSFAVDGQQLTVTDFILDCPPGHHLMMRAPMFEDSEKSETKPLLRPYSPFWTDMAELKFEILVNLKPNGRMTKYMNQLKLGDEVEFRGPIGVYVYEPSYNPGRALLIFSHGVAIAPTIAIVESILQNEDDVTQIYQYSCFENVDSIIFRDKLTEFNKFWNFSSFIYLSQQKCTECTSPDCEHFRKLLKYKERVYSRRLSEEVIRSNLEGIQCTSKQFVVCGSDTFQTFITDCLLQCDEEKENIFVL